MANHHPKINHEERKFLPALSLVIGIILLSLKFYAYHLTGSQSVFSDALESIVNVVAGFITLVVIVVAAKPADEDHPYGHGKVESMAATFEGGAITLAGILIIIQSIQIFFHGAHVEEVNAGLALIVLTGVINGILGFILKLQGKRHHSEAMLSSGAHLMGDALTSIGVLLSLLIVKFTGAQWVDPVIAGFFGTVLCIQGTRILIRSGNVLLDAHDQELLQLLAGLFEKNYVPGVIDIHYTRIIKSGPFHHIECHMVIPEFWSVAEGHTFSENYEQSILKEYPVEAEIRIHLDPCRKVYCENCELADCPIRQRHFIKRVPLNNLDEVTSPTESR